MTIFDNFYNKESKTATKTMTKTIQGLVTFETLITILTIENMDS